MGALIILDRLIASATECRIWLMRGLSHHNGLIANVELNTEISQSDHGPSVKLVLLLLRKHTFTRHLSSDDHSVPNLAVLGRTKLVVPQLIHIAPTS